MMRARTSLAVTAATGATATAAVRSFSSSYTSRPERKQPYRPPAQHHKHHKGQTHPPFARSEQPHVPAAASAASAEDDFIAVLDDEDEHVESGTIPMPRNVKNNYTSLFKRRDEPISFTKTFTGENVLDSAPAYHSESIEEPLAAVVDARAVSRKKLRRAGGGGGGGGGGASVAAATPIRQVATHAGAGGRGDPDDDVDFLRTLEIDDEDDDDTKFVSRRQHSYRSHADNDDGDVAVDAATTTASAAAAAEQDDELDILVAEEEEESATAAKDDDEFAKVRAQPFFDDLIQRVSRNMIRFRKEVSHTRRYNQEMLNECVRPVLQLTDFPFTPEKLSELANSINPIILKGSLGDLARCRRMHMYYSPESNILLDWSSEDFLRRRYESIHVSWEPMSVVMSRFGWTSEVFSDRDALLYFGAFAEYVELAELEMTADGRPRAVPITDPERQAQQRPIPASRLLIRRRPSAATEPSVTESIRLMGTPALQTPRKGKHPRRHHHRGSARDTVEGVFAAVDEAAHDVDGDERSAIAHGVDSVPPLQQSAHPVGRIIKEFSIGSREQQQQQQGEAEEKHTAAEDDSAATQDVVGAPAKTFDAAKYEAALKAYHRTRIEVSLLRKRLMSTSNADAAAELQEKIAAARAEASRLADEVNAYRRLRRGGGGGGGSSNDHGASLRERRTEAPSFHRQHDRDHSRHTGRRARQAEADAAAAAEVEEEEEAISKKIIATAAATAAAAAEVAEAAKRTEAPRATVGSSSSGSGSGLFSKSGYPMAPDFSAEELEQDNDRDADDEAVEAQVEEAVTANEDDADAGEAAAAQDDPELDDLDAVVAQHDAEHHDLQDMNESDYDAEEATARATAASRHVPKRVAAVSRETEKAEEVEEELETAGAEGEHSSEEVDASLDAELLADSDEAPAQPAAPAEAAQGEREELARRKRHLAAAVEKRRERIARLSEALAAHEAKLADLTAEITDIERREEALAAEERRAAAEAETREMERMLAEQRAARQRELEEQREKARLAQLEAERALARQQEAERTALEQERELERRLREVRAQLGRVQEEPQEREEKKAKATDSPSEAAPEAPKTSAAADEAPKATAAAEPAAPAPAEPKPESTTSSFTCTPEQYDGLHLAAARLRREIQTLEGQMEREGENGENDETLMSVLASSRADLEELDDCILSVQHNETWTRERDAQREAEKAARAAQMDPEARELQDRIDGERFTLGLLQKRLQVASQRSVASKLEQAIIDSRRQLSKLRAEQDRLRSSGRDQFGIPQSVSLAKTLRHEGSESQRHADEVRRAAGLPPRHADAGAGAASADAAADDADAEESEETRDEIAAAAATEEGGADAAGQTAASAETVAALPVTTPAASALTDAEAQRLRARLDHMLKDIVRLQETIQMQEEAPAGYDDEETESVLVQMRAKLHQLLELRQGIEQRLAGGLTTAASDDAAAAAAPHPHGVPVIARKSAAATSTSTTAAAASPAPAAAIPSRAVAAAQAQSQQQRKVASAKTKLRKLARRFR